VSFRKLIVPHGNLVRLAAFQLEERCFGELRIVESYRNGQVAAEQVTLSLTLSMQNGHSAARSYGELDAYIAPTTLSTQSVLVSLLRTRPTLTPLASDNAR